MLLFVTQIRHDGLVLDVRDFGVGQYWLPASDWERKIPGWEEYRETTEPGMAINVTQLHGQFGSGDDGLQVVTTHGTDTSRICNAWKGEVHGLKINSLSKTLIQGQIGTIKALIKRDEYTEFLNLFLLSDNIQDHGTLAIGDLICGLFKAEQGPHGAIELSFKDALTLLEQESEDAVGVQPEQPTEQTDEEIGEPAQPQRILFHTPIETLSPLLIVENDDLCRDVWKDLLEGAGIMVHVCGRSEEAEKLFKSSTSHYKIAIMDVHLTPGGNDYLGLDLARTIADLMPDCRILLTSAENGVEHKNQGWGDFNVHGYIKKPVLLDELVTTIDAAANLQSPSPLRDFFHETEVFGSAAYLETTNSGGIKPHTLRDVLSSFLHEAPGVIAHVFQLHARSWRGRSLAGVGERLKWEPYRGKLGKSVIRDTAECNHFILDNNVRVGWQHFWTRQMTHYGSFWGQRLPVPGQYHHVFVIFHSEPEFFSTGMQLRARACAETLTRVLLSQQFDRRGLHDSEYIAAGLGFGCLAHEIYSKLSGIEAIGHSLGNLLSPTDESVSEENIAKLRTKVRALNEHVPDLVINSRILRGPAGGDKPVSVAFCLEKAITGIRQARWELLMHPENVDVKLDQPESEYNWLIRANAGALVTIFFNVLLNAVQQIELNSRIRRLGWVHARIQYYEDAEGLPWALVFITDSGPGIHLDDWERIFDAGHTTKENGTGLGLYICRQLLGRISDGRRQASIHVVRSVLWAGTTLKICFPLLPNSRNEE